MTSMCSTASGGGRLGHGELLTSWRNGVTLSSASEKAIRLRRRASLASAGPGQVLDGELRAFRAYARELLASRIDTTTTYVLIGTIALWPTDFVFHHGHSRAIEDLGSMRLMGVLVCLLVLGLSRRTDVVSRFPTLVFLTMACGGFFGIGWYVSSLGGPGTHHFSMIYFCALFTSGAAVPLAPRFAYCIAIAAAALGGYLSRTPSYLDSPFLAPNVVHLLFATGLSVVFGHLFYKMTLHSFIHQLRLRDKKLEVESLNARLEDRVSEQTRDLRALTAGLESAIERDRRAMAHEIHDQLGQELNAMRYTLAFAQRRAEGAPAVIESALGELHGLLSRTGDSMHRILARLRPRVLEELGPVGAIRWTAEDFERRTEMRTSPSPSGLQANAEPRKQQAPTTSSHAPPPQGSPPCRHRSPSSSQLSSPLQKTPSSEQGASTETHPWITSSHTSTPLQKTRSSSQGLPTCTEHVPP